jgi:hypothetical protein
MSYEIEINTGTLEIDIDDLAAAVVQELDFDDLSAYFKTHVEPRDIGAADEDHFDRLEAAWDEYESNTDDRYVDIAAKADEAAQSADEAHALTKAWADVRAGEEEERNNIRNRLTDLERNLLNHMARALRRSEALQFEINRRSKWSIGYQIVTLAQRIYLWVKAKARRAR